MISLTLTGYVQDDQIIRNSRMAEFVAPRYDPLIDRMVDHRFFEIRPVCPRFTLAVRYKGSKPEPTIHYRVLCWRAGVEVDCPVMLLRNGDKVRVTGRVSGHRPLQGLPVERLAGSLVLERIEILSFKPSSELP